MDALADGGVPRQRSTGERCTDTDRGGGDEGDEIRRALTLGPDDDGRWEIVSRIHRSGDVGTFNTAVDLARSDSSHERLLGVDILAQFGGSPMRDPSFRRPLMS